jgi:hypothetical protein
MGGRGRNVAAASSYHEKPFTPAQVESYLGAEGWSDNMLNSMGAQVFSAPVDSPGLSATKDALVKEYKRRNGSEPPWGK